MNKIALYLLTSIILVTTVTRSLGQNPFYSETIIKYDLATHTLMDKKTIPFDKAFTLVVEKLPGKHIDRVVAFESKFKNGARDLVRNTFTNCDGRRTTRAVHDMYVGTDPKSDTLKLFFIPLRPNKNFDVLVVYKLQDDNRTRLLKINSMIAAGNHNAASAFDDFFNSMVDPLFDVGFFGITNFAQYQAFYTSQLAAVYRDIADTAKYDTTGSLSEYEVQAADIATSAAVSDYKDGNKLMEVSKRNIWVAVQRGLIDINKVFLPEGKSFTEMVYGHTRLKNLESNIVFFDSVFQRVDRAISKGVISTTIGGTTITHDNLRTHIGTIRSNLRRNYDSLSGYMSTVNDALDGNKEIREGSYLAVSTMISDLKTESGNIIFLDAGLTFIGAPALTKKIEYIPKLYWGVSIYFRPIDKNTRQNRFYRKFEPEKNCGCKQDVIRNADGSVARTINTLGPDYGIATRQSILQHLSLNVGITLGSMNNKDFDNLYNSSSLLIGPAYRFKRAFKISTGLALLRRTSKNPLVSDKKMIGAGYLSVSVDIDLLQGLEKITSILFK